MNSQIFLLCFCFFFIIYKMFKNYKINKASTHIQLNMCMNLSSQVKLQKETLLMSKIEIFAEQVKKEKRRKKFE